MSLSDLSVQDLEESILRFRKLLGIWAILYSVVAGFLTISHLYTWGFDPQPLRKFLALHLGVMLLIVFFLHPTTRRWEVREPSEQPWRAYANKGVAFLDIVLAAIATYVTGYLYIHAEALILRTGQLTPTDITIGTLGVLLVLEATRRAVGLPMVILSGLFMLYAMYGSRLRDTAFHVLRTRDRDWQIVVEQLWYGTGGVFGIPLQVAATFVIVFIALGAFFKYSGVGDFFINMAYALTGHRRGGPAKTAILGSAFMGTVSGSSIGNAVSTGAFTIPMMRRVGYRREFAGAVEASASSGGQIMPPILGAAAFIMIEFLNIPYRNIVLAAIIPALAFFVGAWIMVHLEAKKRDLRSVPKNELPDWKLLLRKDWYYLAPFVLLFYLLLSGSVSLFRAGLYVLILTYLFMVFNAWRASENRNDWRRHGALVLPFIAFGILRVMGWRLADSLLIFVILLIATIIALALVRFPEYVGLLRSTREALDEVGRNMAGVSMACAAAGIIGGIVTLTGFGGKFVLLISRHSVGTWESIASIPSFLPLVGTQITSGLIGLVGAPFVIALFFTMIACLVLGMGLPTTATYVVVATIAAPAIVNFPGFVPPNELTTMQWMLAAHMFVLFYGVVADVTPPVSLAAYAAAGIAGGNQFKTGIEAFKISANKFLVPFAFVYQPAILFIGIRWNEPMFLLDLAWDIATIFVGIFFLHAGLSKFMQVHATRWESWGFALGGAFLTFPNWWTDAIAVALIAVPLVTHLRRAKRIEAQPATPA